MDNTVLENMSNDELHNLLAELTIEMGKRNLVKMEMSEPEVTVSGGFGYPVLGGPLMRNGEIIGPSMWSTDN